eukprot:CCRYP_017488-RA/>CCRYP_017488-RA protein AED:0.30 eAED:0.30 QI:710/1/0.9/1/0.44/0.3/10/542/659
MIEIDSNSQTQTTRKNIASFNVSEACSYNFSSSQGRNYGKTGFILHARVAEVTADFLGRVFYEGDSVQFTVNATNASAHGEPISAAGASGSISPWSISPENLRDMVLSNILQEGGIESSIGYSEYPIYGSAIAFEPGVWNVVSGLAEGVTFPASSQACSIDDAFCSENVTDVRDVQLTELNTNPDGLSIYSPYAYRGPPDQTIYANCSRDQPMYCPSMDLSFAYDYSNISNAQAEWYNAPRCLYLRDGIASGYWTSPYFDAGAGGINMVTYSQPILSQAGKFLGIVTIDVKVEALCYGDQCDVPIDYNYLTNIRPVGLTASVVAMSAAVGCALWTYCYRSDRVVKASQPFFLMIICMGCFVMSSSIIPLSIDDSIASEEGASMVRIWSFQILTDMARAYFTLSSRDTVGCHSLQLKACMAFPWLLSIGFTMTFSALFSKIWRLNRVYHNASQLRRVKVSQKEVMMPFVILMTANFGLLLAWTLIDPRVWHRTEPDDYHNSEGYCAASGEAKYIFVALIGAVNLLALILANMQAFRARRITTEFSESSYVMMTMVSLLQALLISIPLLVLVQDNEIVFYFVMFVLIFTVTTATLGLMFGPKIVLVRQRALEAAQSRDRNETSNDNVNGTSNTEGRECDVVIEAVRSKEIEGNASVISGTF